MRVKRLLYLGFALPPGNRERHPQINPAGNAMEVQMIAALRTHFDFKSVGCLPFPMQSLPESDPSMPGMPHDLTVIDQAPEVWHRTKALAQLKAAYEKWKSEGWVPDAILVYNFSPIYNAFIRWLKWKAQHPQLVLLLLDSSQLGTKLSASKRFRYLFKPFVTPDEAMLKNFDSCIGLSTDVKRFTDPHGMKFLWMPGACTPKRMALLEEKVPIGPLQFLYFGALAAHAGVLPMVRAFLDVPGDSQLHLAGYGKQTEELKQLSEKNPRFIFHGMLKPDDCLRLGKTCDVLINPRPPGYGNDNNFPSKLFDYALCARGVVCTRMSGSDQVFGPEAFYIEPGRFDGSMREAITLAISAGREDLLRRGAAISARVQEEYNWNQQAGRMAEFLNHL